MLKNNKNNKNPYINKFNSIKYKNKKTSAQKKLVQGKPKNKMFVNNIMVVKLGANNHKELNSVVYLV